MSVKIIMAFCFVPIVFLMFGILYFEGKRKGNILLGVTLWPGAEQEKRVQEIRGTYKHAMWFWLAVCLGLFAASCLPRNTSISVSLQLLWLILVMVIFFVPHFSANRKLKEAKREWLASRVDEAAGGSRPMEDGGRRTEEADETVGRMEAEGRYASETAEAANRRHVDVTAAAQAPPRPFWKAGFAGALLGFVPVLLEPFLVRDSFYGWWTELTLLSLASGGLALLWIMWHFWRMRTDVVSWRSEVNQQVARVRQYQWGRFWCLAVWESTVFLFILWYGMHRPHQLFGITIAGTFVVTVLLLIQMIFTERNIRKAYEAYADKTYWEEAEDEHWLGGIFYYNEKDTRFMVNKRVGVGTTVNLAKTSGKVFMGVACALTAGLLLWAAILLPAYDFVPISLEVADGQVISRQFGQEYAVPVEEIEAVELLTELPSMSKRVGSATDTLYKGSFLDQDYRSCKVCVRVEKPPFVKIITKDGMVFYLNGENEEETRAAYDKILDRRESAGGWGDGFIR